MHKWCVAGCIFCTPEPVVRSYDGIPPVTCPASLLTSAVPGEAEGGKTCPWTLALHALLGPHTLARLRFLSLNITLTLENKKPRDTRRGGASISAQRNHLPILPVEEWFPELVFQCLQELPGSCKAIHVPAVAASRGSTSQPHTVITQGQVIDGYIASVAGLNNMCCSCPRV